MKLPLPKSPFVTLLILLNAVPVYGVLYWNWQSFDLIFLYWIENLIIGLFTIVRFLLRPYKNAHDIVHTLFKTLFFIIHYGLFCFGHGSFILQLFGGNVLGELSNAGIFEVILPVIENQHLFWPVVALFTYQLADWWRDTSEHGLGGDNIKILMIAPYRRITVLHISILASGFALTAMDEPVAGLFILIIIKTVFDIYHWNKDERAVSKEEAFEIDDKVKSKIDSFLDNPTITVNGMDIHFESYEGLKSSKYYGLMQSMLGIAGGDQKIRQVEAYIEQRINEKRLSSAVPHDIL